MQITKFAIERLNGLYNYDIPIVDNKIIIVGENGSGKSTILSIIYFILSKQWAKLTNYDFKAIKITLNDQLFEFSNRELKEYTYLDARPSKNSVNFYIRREVKALGIDIKAAMESESILNDFSNHLRFNKKIHVPRSSLQTILWEIYSQAEIEIENRIHAIDKFISNALQCPVIFLPTYRRIERDLSSIFPDYEKKPSYEIQFSEKNTKEKIEMIEFGMSDVKDIIKRSMENLEQSFRTGTQKLMANYLQDILMHKHEKQEENFDKEFKEKSLDEILSRIDTETLSGHIKETIKSNILKIKDENSENLSESDKVISHFISKLIKLNEDQTENEKLIREFTNVCNNYLIGKKIIFNQLDFTIKIYHTDENWQIIGNKNIPFDALSSGEKQIVSLFSHLYLSDNNKSIIIIDEPELSLSVSWQRKFLEDIVHARNCIGLFCVTHSPFIFENSLDSYACPIGQYMERTPQ